MVGEHIDSEGRFQSDKYPTTPPDLVPLKVTDVTAQDLLWTYAERRRSVDAAFAEDLQARLVEVGFEAADPEPLTTASERSAAQARASTLNRVFAWLRAVEGPIRTPLQAKLGKEINRGTYGPVEWHPMKGAYVDEELV